MNKERNDNESPLPSRSRYRLACTCVDGILREGYGVQRVSYDTVLCEVP